MINSKSQLMTKLKADKDSVKFKTIKHFRSESVGVIRIIGETGTLQTNAFTLSTLRADGRIVDAWLWLRDFDVCNGIMTSKDGEIIYELIG